MLHETLWASTEEIEQLVAGQQIVLSEDAKRILHETYAHGMRYNEVLQCHVPIETRKGKKTKAYFHSVVTRMESGRYEVVCYAS